MARSVTAARDTPLRCASADTPSAQLKADRQRRCQRGGGAIARPSPVLVLLLEPLVKPCEGCRSGRLLGDPEQVEVEQVRVQQGDGLTRGIRASSHVANSAAMNRSVGSSPGSAARSASRFSSGRSSGERSRCRACSRALLSNGAKARRRPNRCLRHSIAQHVALGLARSEQPISALEAVRIIDPRVVAQTLLNTPPPGLERVPVPTRCPPNVRPAPGSVASLRLSAQVADGVYDNANRLASTCSRRARAKRPHGQADGHPQATSSLPGHATGVDQSSVRRASGRHRSPSTPMICTSRPLDRVAHRPSSSLMGRTPAAVPGIHRCRRRSMGAPLTAALLGADGLCLAGSRTRRRPIPIKLDLPSRCADPPAPRVDGRNRPQGSRSPRDASG